MLNNRIRNILARNEDARSNDKVLQLEVWETYGLNLSDNQKRIFMDLPSSETIRRTRQKLQENGLYPATDNVKKYRKFKGLSIRQRIHGTKPEKVDNLINERIPFFND